MEPSSKPGVSAQLVGKQHASQEEPTHSLAPKATGTGVFMPLTMRTVSSNAPNDGSLNRSKPTRRRNLTSPSILPSCHTDKEPPRRSVSSSNLAARHRKAPNSRKSFSNLDACLEGQGAANQGPLADVAIAMNAAASITASACNTSGVNESTAAAAAKALMPQGPMSRAFSTPHQANMVLHPSGPQGIDHRAERAEHVLLSSPEPQQQHMLRQHTAPGQLPVLIGSSSDISPRSSITGTSGMLGEGSNADSTGLLDTRLDSAVAAAAAAAAAAGSLGLGSTLPGRGSAPISTEALETFFGPSALQPAELGPRAGGSTPVDSCIDVGAAVSQPLSTAGGSRQSLDVATAAVPQQPCSPGQAAASTSVASHAHAVGSSDIYSQLSFNKWTGPHAPSGLAGSDSFESALTTDVSPSDADLEQHEQQIQKRIEELLVMKQLLKLKQQHKQQQMQLQMQQLRQEQELQQVLASLQSAKDDSPFEVQRSASSWSGGATSGVAASGNTTSQPSQQQQSLQVQCGGNSLEHFQREALQQQLQQLQRQQQQQVAAQAPGGGLVTHMQQDLLPQLQVERSQGSFGNANLELQQLRQLQQELLMKQQQQLSLQHSAGSLSSANRTMLMLQPAMSAPAPCSDGMLGFGSRPGPAASGFLDDLTGLDSLNGQSFDGVLPMLYNNTSSLGSNSAACNGGFGVSPSNAQLPLTTLHDEQGRRSNMGQISTAVSGGAQGNAAGWGSANGQMGMNSSTGGMSGFQLF